MLGVPRTVHLSDFPGTLQLFGLACFGGRPCTVELGCGLGTELPSGSRHWLSPFCVGVGVAAR